MSEITEYQIREAVATKAGVDADFRTSLLDNPRGAIEGLIGSSLPGDVSVNIVEDSDSSVTISIPPLASEELSADQLEAVAGGFLDAKGMGSSVFGDGMVCLLGGGLVNSKMEINL